jgi:cell wall-associated NlpC family hydrolase
LNKKLISATVAIAFVFTANFAVVKADLASDKAKLQQIQAQRSELENKITLMDSQIETIMSQISSNKESIAAKQKEIDLAQADISKAEEELKAEQLLYQERVRAMYISGTSASTLEILFDARSFEDLLSRAENIKRIMDYNISIINDFKEKKKVLDEKEAALEVEKNALVALEKDNETKLSELKAEKSDQASLIAKLKEQESKYGSQIAAAEAAELAAAKAALEKAKQEAAAQASSSYTSRGDSSSSTVSSDTAVYSPEAVIAYASKFLGVPYVWGGTTPAGFDCSGFVKYVFAHFGITLPRVAADQQKVGTYVSREDLQPGDLVFFGDPAHHVGIYIGNGYMIHAPHTGDVVKIGPLNSDFSYGRRIR